MLATQQVQGLLGLRDPVSKAPPHNTIRTVCLSSRWSLAVKGKTTLLAVEGL